MSSDLKVIIMLSLRKFDGFVKFTLDKKLIYHDRLEGLPGLTGTFGVSLYTENVDTRG